MSLKEKVWKFSAAAILALVFGWLVWPTPYIYSTEGQNFYRAHRLSGVTEEATTDGWKRTKF